MVKRIYCAWMLVAAFAMTGCESLEDTYSDYAGDGMIRYVGRCADVTVTPGWERLHIEWKNNLDPAVENIKVVCQAGSIIRDTLLEAQATSCDIRGMEDGNYQVDVYGVGEGGELSLSDPQYSRPYTYEHEEVRSFSLGIVKHFFVGNNLVLFMDTWSDRFVNFKLNYTGTDGQAKILELSDEIFAEKYYLLRDVDVSKDVFITREGRIEGCLDQIRFEPYELGTDPMFSASFRGWVREHYRLDEIGNDFVNGMTSLEFDYDILSLEDVLYCPNLEKIELGKHRYLLNDESMLQMYGDDWCSVVSDLEKSEFVLKVAQELKGLKIERWHKHYFPATTTLDITEMGIPEVPADLNYLSTSGWTIAHSQEGNVSEQFPLKNLLDNNSATIWMPLSHTVLLSYDITIDMQAEQTINGIKIVQAGMESALGFLPGSVQIEVSNDGYEWEMFAHVQDIALGNGFGEAMVYRLNEPRQARYIKVSVSDRLTGVMNVALGDIAVF